MGAATARVVVESTDFVARALLLSERINVRELAFRDRVSGVPSMYRYGRSGALAVFRFGVLVLFNLTSDEARSLVQATQRLLTGPYPTTLEESLEIHVDPAAGAGIIGERLNIPVADPQSLQLVADVLAKSLVLEFYEDQLSATFDQIEPLAKRLHRYWRRVWSPRELANQIGHTLLTEHRMVGRVEIKDKPDVLWDHPELEGLFLRLADEYELTTRQSTLEHKLGLITRTAEILLRLEETRRSLRAEWYIIVLILVEILLTLYEMFVR